jgi:hypothetical protein
VIRYIPDPNLQLAATIYKNGQTGGWHYSILSSPNYSHSFTMHFFTLALFTILPSLVLASPTSTDPACSSEYCPRALSGIDLPASSHGIAPTQTSPLTNAQRLARGLPLKPPRRRATVGARCTYS